MLKRALPLLVLGACVGHSGAPVYRVSVDSLADPSASAKRAYYILPGREGVSPEDLQFREFAGQADMALYYQGFRLAQDPANADVLVFLAYGIGEPLVQYYSVPVWGAVPTGTSTSTVNATTTVHGNTAYTTETTTTRQNTTLGITGYRTESQVTYARFLSLSAVDAAHYKATGKLREVWRTTVISSGTTSDLRRAIPVMMAAAMRGLAKDSGGAVEVRLAEDHPAVLFVRRRIPVEQFRASER